MKTPSDNDLNKVYEAFSQEHDHLRQTLMASLFDRSKQHKKTGWVNHVQLFIGDTIMKSRITKLAVAAVVIVGVLVVLHQLGGSIDGSSIAFAEVLEHIQKSSYTFDLSVAAEDGASGTVKAMVLERGRMRVDMSTGLGKISSVVDMTEDKTLMLFHNKQKAVMMETPGTDTYREGAGILALSMKPVENLWNLRDGTEKKLGKKDIYGQSADGYRIFQEDEYCRHEITVWADGKTGIPILVEMVLSSLEDSSKSMSFTMSNFDLNVELDEGLFSLEVPAGYTRAYQLDLDELEGQTKSTNEAQKVEKVLALWSDGKRAEAARTLLEIDWTRPITFSKKSYFFSLTEEEFIALKEKDQQQVIKEIMRMAGQVRPIVKEVLSQGQATKSARDYIKAEQHFEAVREFGRLLTRDSEQMLVVRLVGLATRRKALDELKVLYEETNQQQKLQRVEKEIQAVEAKGEEIKRIVSGQ